MALSKLETKIGKVYIKIRQIFKSDIYILDNKYIIAGTLSEENTFGTYLFILTDTYQEAFNELYESHKLVYINDITEYKKEFSNEYVSYKDDDKKLIQSISSSIMNIINKLNKTNSWKKLSELSEEKLTDLFEEKRSIMIESDLSKNVIMVTNKLFPLIKDSSANNLEYGFTPSGSNYYEIFVIRETEPMFIMDGLFYFLGMNA